MTKKMHKYSGKKLSRGEPPNFLGQHLLHNKRLLKEIVDQAAVSKTDTVVELGAGKGALTTILSQRAGKVLAVEYDDKYADYLKRITAHCPNTKVIQQDIMKIILPKGKFVVVSNIPYSITTPIMKLLLSNPSSGLQRGVIVMEKGAAKRFTGEQMKNAYVLLWRMWFDIHYVQSISRNHFSPPPSVESAMITIRRKAAPIIPVKDYLAFRGLAEYVLREPNAVMAPVLRGIFTSPQLKHLRRELKVGSDVPVWALSERQWGLVFQAMKRYVPQPLWPRVRKKDVNRY